MNEERPDQHSAPAAAPEAKKAENGDDSTLPFEGSSQARERYATVGEELRRERELREITLQEISEDTKISIPNLKAIEDNEFQKLPGGIYTKNFIRAYCRYLGINEEKMVNHYLYQTSPREPGTNRNMGFERTGSDAPWKPLALTGLAIVALAALLWLVISHPGWFGLSGDDTTGPGPSSSQVDAAGAMVGPPVPLNFTFRADDDTWVVVEVDGQPRMNRHLKKGEFFEVRAQEQVVLGVEDAGVLAWTINGRTARPLGGEGEVVNNLAVDQSNWRDWLQHEPAEGDDGT